MATVGSSRNPTRQFVNPLFREIYKNSWLTKIPNDHRKRKERVWVVFCVHDDTEAYLEAYNDNKTAALHKPNWFIPLNSTRHISPTICPYEQEYVFVVTLANEIAKLAAPSWESMLDWVDCLHSKLVEMKVLSPKENLYSKLPVEVNSVTSPGSNPANTNLLPTRDPTSPLPPTPSQNAQPRRHQVAERDAPSSETANVNDANSVTIIQVSNQSETENNEVNNYDSVFNFLPVTNNAQMASANGSQRRGEVSADVQPLSPQPYKTLREQQVLQLQSEIQHPVGVRLQIRRKDCITSIALADAMDAVWVCGWNQKEHPILYNTLHIGDRLMSIEEIPVQSVNDVHQILRNIPSRVHVSIVVKRVPFGRVFVLRREVEGQSLGLVQDGNTATLAAVVEDGLAARQGLPTKVRTCDGKTWTCWVLTEVNGRPLNLFFKETEVKDRLNAVGRDISILVQPLDLIKQLKKQLKAMRNYKDYILQ